MFLDPLQRQQLKRNCYVLNLSNFCKIDLSSSQVFCLFIPRFQLNTLRSCIVQQRNVKVNVAFVPGPWVQRFQQSHRQEDKGSQEAPPCIVRRQAPVAKKCLRVLERKWKTNTISWIIISMRLKMNTISRSKSFLGPAPMYPPSMKDPPWM